MSTAETQSLSLMQAYASGTPALAARSRGLVDYTPEGCGFLIEPGNVTELADNIAVLLSDHDLRQRNTARWYCSSRHMAEEIGWGIGIDLRGYPHKRIPVFFMLKFRNEI